MFLYKQRSKLNNMISSSHLVSLSNPQVPAFKFDEESDSLLVSRKTLHDLNVLTIRACQVTLVALGAYLAFADAENYKPYDTKEYSHLTSQQIKNWTLGFFSFLSLSFISGFEGLVCKSYENLKAKIDLTNRVIKRIEKKSFQSDEKKAQDIKYYQERIMMAELIEELPLSMQLVAGVTTLWCICQLWPCRI